MTDRWWDWPNTQRPCVHVDCVTRQNQQPFYFKIKRKCILSVSLSKGLQPNRPSTELRAFSMPPFFGGKKKVTNEEYRQRKWYEHTAEAICCNGPQYNISDVCSPTAIDGNVQEKKIQMFWGLCLNGCSMDVLYFTTKNRSDKMCTCYEGLHTALLFSRKQNRASTQ